MATYAPNAECQREPLYSLYGWLQFVWLCRKPELLKGVYDMGFNAPSKIQETALPALLADPLVPVVNFVLAPYERCSIPTCVLYFHC